jgi:glutaminase
MGDTEVKFSMQSISKVLAYAYIYDQIGGEEVHQWVGEEPSGQSFNAPVFDKQGRPHNPMVNPGAIMICALLLRHGFNLPDLVSFYQNSTLSDSPPTYDEQLYREEKLTGHTNHALTRLMLANKAFPQYKSEEQTNEGAERALDLYFKNCSIMVNTRSLARFGAMLANNGIVPSTGERMLKTSTV